MAAAPVGQTAKTVDVPCDSCCTSLKRGVNERVCVFIGSAMPLPSRGQGNRVPISDWVSIVLNFDLMQTLMFHFISREIVREGVGQRLSYRKSTESLASLNRLNELNKLRN
jgi:hypothetical protein